MRFDLHRVDVTILDPQTPSVASPQNTGSTLQRRLKRVAAKPRLGATEADGTTKTARDQKNMAMGQNLVPLVNIKIAGIYGCELPTNIDNNRF